MAFAVAGPASSVALVRVRRAAVRFAPVVLRAYRLARSYSAGRGGDATSTPDASRCRFTTATRAPASALVVNRRRRPVELPPRLTGSSRTTLVRFRVFLRPCSVHRSRRAVTGVANPATIPLRRFLPGRHPPVWHAPLRFSQRLAPTSFLSRCRRRLAGHSSPVSLLARRTGPAGSFSRPGRTHRRASTDARGVRCPFAALILPAGEGVFPRLLGPTCRLVRPRRRGWFSSRLSRQAVATMAETRRAASGLLPRGQAVPCGPPAPL